LKINDFGQRLNLGATDTGTRNWVSWVRPLLARNDVIKVMVTHFKIYQNLEIELGFDGIYYFCINVVSEIELSKKPKTHF
jgi:hypothetical protein